MRVLVFQHIGVEHPGILRDFMTADGSRWDAVELDRGDEIPQSLAAYDALIVMGGPMDVWDEDRYPWLAAEKAAIRDWVVERGKPYLGICLGHQLLAEAVGGTVEAMATAEVGVCPIELTEAGREDTLFRQVKDRFAGFQWHSSEVTSLPEGAMVSAINAAGSIQAFRYRSCAFGLQFHVEITSDTVREWSEVDAYRRSLEATLGPGGRARIEQDAVAGLAGFHALARRIYINFTAAVRDSMPAGAPRPAAGNAAAAGQPPAPVIIP